MDRRQSTNNWKALIVIPYGRQQISDEDIAAVNEVLRSDSLTQGKMVPRFEQAVAVYCGVSYAVAVNSATSGLHIACLALGLGHGDWLWTSPITFVASANCALYCNAYVDFVDIDPHTYNISIERLTEKLREAERENRLPKIVVPVHLCGQSCDMEAIHALSLRYGFKIIEDASHAIGGSYQEKSIGNCRYSDITVFSFHPVKIITTGEGGMATTNRPELADRMMRYRSHGITNERSLMQPKPAAQIWNYQQIDLGFNYRMTDIQAALGASQLKRIDDFIRRRHEIAAEYDRAFADLPVQAPWQHPDTRSSYHLYPIRAQAPGRSQRDVYEALHRNGVAANLHYIPVYLQPYYAAMGFSEGYCQEAEAYFKEAISLPIYASLTEEQQEHVISAVRTALA
jgi:UDP-4-amino-4,6-dideoxy-N-acetyl-beta-L-altrosamine transaminase